MMFMMDTKTKVTELLATGLTQQELADLVPCSQAAINAYLSGKRGSRPSYPIGRRLDELHGERVLKTVKRRRSTDKGVGK
jgi:predicted transcriptional regulator